MSLFQTTCPSCGATIETYCANSVAFVCSYCKSTIIQNEVAKDLDSSAVIEDFSPLQISTRGRYQGVDFAIRGRLQIRSDDVFWNEWFIVFDDNRQGWLSETNGNYVLTQQVNKTPTDYPSFKKLRIADSKYEFNDKLFFLSDKRIINSSQIVIQGELALNVTNSGFTQYLTDWRCEQYFLTIDYGDSENEKPILYFGETVELKDLDLSFLRTDDEIKRTAGALRGELSADRCPHCGAPVQWISGISEYLTCSYCTSEIKISSQKLELIEAHDKREKKLKEMFVLQLGMQAIISGSKYTVIGLIQQEIPHTDIFWNEYLLYDENARFLWLVETAEGKWTLSRVINSLPTLNKEAKPINSSLIEEYSGQVRYVAGAFYWRVKAGDKNKYYDYTESATSYLSAEINQDEMLWTRQIKLDVNSLTSYFFNPQTKKHNEQFIYQSSFQNKVLSKMTEDNGDEEDILPTWVKILFTIIVLIELIIGSNIFNSSPINDNIFPAAIFTLFFIIITWIPSFYHNDDSDFSPVGYIFTLIVLIIIISAMLFGEKDDGTYNSSRTHYSNGAYHK